MKRTHDIGGGVIVTDDGRQLVATWKVSAHNLETAAVAHQADAVQQQRFNAAIGWTGRTLEWIRRHIAGDPAQLNP